ncbi:MAG: heme-binding protein [Kiritimatiellae bacterium]|nr:heme-binding protein [Kiritimatiellia bacterium]
MKLSRYAFNVIALAFIAIILGTMGAMTVMATEEAEYKVIKAEQKFEIRDYAPHILAEILISGSLKEAGNKAFRPLFKYISGDNSKAEKVAMTAPVSQQAAGEKIAMTAPVSQQATGDSWAVSFMMPASYTMETIPQPENPSVKLRLVPAHRMATIRYSGFWSEKRYNQHKQKLEEWIKANQLIPAGAPVWARYNPPFTPWFLRRNEILIPIKATPLAPNR